MIPEVKSLRTRGLQLLVAGGWLVVLIECLMIPSLGKYALDAAIVSVLLNLLPTWCMLQGRVDRHARMIVGVAAAMQPALLVFATQGTLWQIDMHLSFFVALVAMTLLCDIRPIIYACAFILLHHGTLTYVAPDWVFANGIGAERVAIHSIAAALIGVCLCFFGIEYGRVLRRSEHARIEGERQSQENLETNAKLEAAIAQIEAEQEARTQALEAASRERKAEFERVAQEFEGTVNAVTRSVASTAQLLEDAAGQLKLISDATGNEARVAVGSAENASRAANTVAAGVAELSLAIAEVAVNVDQQSELTHLATERSEGGGRAIGSLTDQSRTIGEATRAIVRIAERTNLLSLNAAIEAASAGASGRGFSIVAHEVKVLAQQAGTAATQIETFLKGVRSGTLEAERSFQAIDSAVAELDKAATLIRYDVDSQRQSADTIESFARKAAAEVDVMVGQIRALSDSACASARLSDELDRAAAALAENIHNLEKSTQSFTSRLKSA
jgi:methyl-accepting chemotaxis protein